MITKLPSFFLLQGSRRIIRNGVRQDSHQQYLVWTIQEDF